MRTLEVVITAGMLGSMVIVLSSCSPSPQQVQPVVSDVKQSPSENRVASGSKPLETRSIPSNSTKSTISVDLPKLWGASKKDVKQAMHGQQPVEEYKEPVDYPDPRVAGGEIKVYNLAAGLEVCVNFNSKGYVTIVYVDNRMSDKGLGFTLDQWKDNFARFGLPECGDPAKTAPVAYYWGPPHNRTGGFEIAVVANNDGRVWQVMVSAPETVYAE